MIRGYGGKRARGILCWLMLFLFMFITVSTIFVIPSSTASAASAGGSVSGSVYNVSGGSGIPGPRLTASPAGTASPPPAPAADKPSGNYPTGTTVSLSSSVSAAIYYTTDTSSPEVEGRLYTGPITIENNLTLNAVAVADNVYSDVVSYYYTTAPIILKEWNLTDNGQVNSANRSDFEIGATFAASSPITRIALEISADGTNWYSLDSREGISVNSDTGVVQDGAGNWTRNLSLDLSGLDDGQYQVRATAADIDDNNLQEETPLTVNTSVPNVTDLSVNANGADNALVLTWTNPASDFGCATVYKYVYYSEGTSGYWSELTCTTDNTYTDSNVVPYTTYYYMVQVSDPADNASPNPPVVSGSLAVTSPISLVEWDLDDNGNVTSINDSDFWVGTLFAAAGTIESISYQYSTDGATFAAIPQSQITHADPVYAYGNNEWYAGIGLNLQSLADGTYWLQATATDTAGNTLSVQTKITKKTACGDAAALTVAPNAADNALVLNWTNAPDFSCAEVDRYVYSSYYSSGGYWDEIGYDLTTNTFTDTDAQFYNTYYYRVVDRDSLGNQSANPPVVSGSLAAGPITFERWSLGSSDHQIDAANAAGYQVEAYFLAPRQLASIAYSYSTDGATWQPLDEYTSSSGTLGYYSYTSESYESYRYICLNVSGPNGLPDGTYYVQAVATDTLGNNLAVDCAVYKHTTPPANVTGLAVAPDAADSSLVLTWTNPAADFDHAVIGRNGYYLNQTTGDSYTDTSATPGVTYQYTVTAVDAPGNQAVNPPSVTGVIPTAGPVLDSMSPSGQYTTTGSSIGYQASFFDSQPVTTILFDTSTDGASWTPLNAGAAVPTYSGGSYYVSGNWDTSSVGNAVYQLRATAADAAGRRASVESTVCVCHIAPAAPANFAATVSPAGPGVAPVVTLTWDPVADAGGYYLSRQYANGSYGGSASWYITAPAHSYTDNSYLQPGGTYTYSLYAYNGGQYNGNHGPTVTVTVNVYCTGPTLELDAGLTAYSAVSNYTLTGHTDPGAGVTVNGAAATVNADGSFSYSTTLTSTTTYLTVVATLNGKSNTLEQQVIEDSTAPTGPSYWYPSDGSVVGGHNVQVLADYFSDNETGIARTVLQVSRDDGVTWTDVAQAAGTAYIYWDTTAPVGSPPAPLADGSYKFRMAGYDYAGNVAYSSVHVLTLNNTPPAVPQGLTATAAEGQVILSWQADTEPDFSYYNVYRSTISGGGYQMVGSVSSGTSYQDTGTALVTSAPFYYVVTAVDRYGNESAYSPEVQARPLPDTTPPKITSYPWQGQTGTTTIGPAQLNSYGYYTVDATDDSPQGVKSIIIGLSADGGATWTNQTYTATAAGYWGYNGWVSYGYSYATFYLSSFRNNLVQGGNLMSFTAQDYSGNVSAAVYARLYVDLAVGAPQNLRAQKGQGAVILTWDPSADPNVARYTILRSNYITGGFSSVGSVAGTVYTYTDKTVTIGQTYYYMVESDDSYGNTADSNVVAGEGADDLTPPDMISVSPADGADSGGPAISITVLASDNKAVASFNVSYSTDGGAAWTPAAIAGESGPSLYTTLPSGDKEYAAELTWSTAGLASGAYKVRITATDPSGNASTPLDVTWNLDLAVSAVTNLRGTPGDGSVVLSWTPITDPDVRTYNTYHILRGIKPGGPYTTDLGWTSQNTPGISDTTGILPSTTYYYVVDSYDNRGNTDRSQELAVTTAADTTPPAITSVSPANGTTVGGPTIVTLTVHVQDDYALDNARAVFAYSLDGTSWTTIADDYGPRNNYGDYYFSTYWNLQPLTSGIYTVSYTVYDSAGNLYEQLAHYQVDRTPPSPPANLTAIYGSGEISLAWQAPPEAAIDHYVVYRGNENAGPFSKVGQVPGRTNVLFTDSTVKSGLTYYYEVTAVDKFNQEGAASNIAKAAAVTDTVPPAVDGIAPADGTFLGPQATITVLASDNVALANITLQYSLDSGTTWNTVTTIATQNKAVFQWAPPAGLQDAAVQVRAVAEDAAGNLSDGTPVRSYTVDTQGPAQVTGVVASGITATGVTLNWNDVPDQDFAYFLVQQKNSPAGDWAYLGTGGVASSGLTLTSPSLDKIANARGVQVNGLKPETTYWFRVVAYDQLGNCGTYSDEVQVTAAGDTTPPTAGIQSPQPGMFSKAINLSAGATDDVAVASLTVQYSGDQHNWTDLCTQNFAGNQATVTAAYQWDVSRLPEGDYYVRATATDEAGNTGRSGVYEYIVDHTPPAVPAGLAVTATAGYVDVAWNQNTEQDLAGYRVYRAVSAAGPYTVQTGAIYASGGGGSFYRDRDVAFGSTYWYEVTAFDLAGNESAAAGPLPAAPTADTTPPTIVAVKPDSGQALPAYPTIHVLAEDDCKVARVELDYQPAGSPGPWSLIGAQSFASYYAEPDFTWNTAGLDNGRYAVRATATDAAGNTSVADCVYYNLNVNPPAAPVLTATPGGCGILLSWTSGHEPDLAGFVVLRHGQGEPFQALKRQTGTGFNDAPLQPDVPYTYMVEAVDTFGNISQSNQVTAAATDADSIPPVAVPGDDQTITSDMEASFDGTASTDNNCVTRYLWDFGDGSPASDLAQPSHAYTSPGIYTVTLWVYDPAGNVSAPGTCKVTVVPPQLVGNLEVQVLDDTSGAPLPGASVLIQFPDGSTRKAVTSGTGVACVVAAAGDYQVYAFKDGYKPAEVAATLRENQQTTATVRLKSGQLVVGQLTVHRMTLDEIIAAGIDINAPENQYVFKFEVHLAFKNTPLPPQELTVNGDGEILGGGGGGGISFTDSDGDQEIAFPEAIAVPDHPEVQPTIAYLVIPGEAHWLKEFFQVGLSLQNTADPQFVIDNATATLTLPDGLSLAPTANRQSLQAALGSIAGGDSRNVQWIIRGDQPGYYNLQATFNGILEPFGDQVSTVFRTKEPFRVWGGDALKMHIVAQDRSDKDYPYNVSFGLENVSDHGVYNLSFFLKDQGKQNYIYAPNQNLTASIMDLEPGQTLWKSYQLIPSIEGDLDLGDSYVLQTGGNTKVQSDFTSVSVPENAPGTAPVLHQTNKTDGTVELSWDKVDGAKEYKIYRIRNDLQISMDPQDLVYTGGPDQTWVTLPEPDGPHDYVINTVVNTVYGDEEVLRHAMTGVTWQSKSGLPAITVDPETIPVGRDSELLVTVNSQGYPVAGGTVDIGDLVTGTVLDQNGQARITVHPQAAGDLAITAWDPNHQFLSSITIPVFTPAPPAAPTGLTAALQGGTGALLSWNSNREFDLAGYNVYQLVDDQWRKLNSDTVTAVNYAVYGLNYGNTYYFEVTALNRWGQESAFSYPAAAATGPAPDTVPPWIVATGPQDQADGVPTNVQITLDFSKRIQPGPNFGGITVGAGGAPVRFSPTTAKKFLILQPEGNLPENTVCVVSVPAGAVQDLSGNTLAAGYNFSFTLDSPPDTTPPAVTTANMQGPVIRVVFSEAVQEGDWFDAIALTADGAPVGYAAAIDSKDSHTLIISPDGPGTHSSYQLTLPAGAVKDLAGNALPEDRTLSVGSALTLAAVPALPDIKVPYGTALAQAGLPGSVTADLSDGGTRSLNVTWDGGTPPYDPLAGGSYAFRGTLDLPGGVTNPSSVTAAACVVVQPQKPQPLTVTSVPALLDIKVPWGTALAQAGLPGSVTADLSDGGTRSLNVTWDGGTPPYDPLAAGSYAFRGTLDLPGGVTNPGSVTAAACVVVQPGGATPGPSGPSPGGGGGGGGAPVSSTQTESSNTPAPSPVPAPAVAAPAFADLPAGYWAVGAIVHLQAAGIIHGYPDGTFRPDRAVTRGEAAVMLARALGLKNAAGHAPTFGDLPPDHWAYGPVRALAAAGIITGYGDGAFRPDAPVQRQELVAMIMRAWHYLDKPRETGSPATLDRFRDAAAVSPWAQRSCAEAVELGVADGLAPDRFGPLATADRAQTAVLIYKLWQPVSPAATPGEGN